MKYYAGQEVKQGDIVSICPSRKAKVKLIFESGSSLSVDYACPEGGVFLEFEDGDCQVSAIVHDPEIKLVCRK